MHLRSGLSCGNDKPHTAACYGNTATATGPVLVLDGLRDESNKLLCKYFALSLDF